MKKIAILIVTLIITGCHKEVVENYQWTPYYKAVITKKAMHESWSGDSFYMEFRLQSGEIKDDDDVDKSFYYLHEIGDTVEHRWMYLKELDTVKEFL